MEGRGKKRATRKKKNKSKEKKVVRGVKRKQLKQYNKNKGQELCLSLKYPLSINGRLEGVMM